MGHVATAASFVAVGLSISALIAKAIAQDPPDPNYTQVMVVGPEAYDATTEAGRLANAAMLLGDASAASLVAYERYLGASEDQASQFEEIQRNAFFTNEALVQGAASEIGQALPQLAASLDTSASASQIDAVVQEFLNTDLPPELLSPLAALGIGEDEFKQGALDKFRSFPMAVSPSDLLSYGDRGLAAAAQLPGTLLQSSAVPAPSTLSLVIAAVVCALWTGRNRRRPAAIVSTPSADLPRPPLAG